MFNVCKVIDFTIVKIIPNIIKRIRLLLYLIRITNILVIYYNSI